MVEAGRVTTVIDGDISQLKASMDQAKQLATSTASDIEKSASSSLSGGFSGVSDGLKKSLSGGGLSGIGKELGGDLIGGVTSSLGPLGGVASSVATAFGPAGAVATAAIAGSIVIGSAAVRAAAEWQTAMTGIGRTTGMEGAPLEQLSGDLQNIRMETGATVASIAGVAQTAGSIGIPTDELSYFTKAALQMGSAFGMSSETASEAMGKIGNVAKPATMSWTEFAERGGSAVDGLANQFATSETEILTGMKHLGATMGFLQPSEETLPAWMATVAAVQSLGLAGDQAGEAIQDAFTYAAKNASSKELGIDVAGLLGKSNEQLQLDLRSNAPEVLKEAAIAINALPLEEQAAALAMFGSTGSKAVGLLMGDLDPLTGKFKILDSAIQTSSSSFKSGTGLSSSYASSMATFDSAISRITATASVGLQKIGGPIMSALSPVMNAVADGMGKVIQIGSNLWGPITAGLSPLTSGISAVAGAFGTLTSMQLDGLVAGTSAINNAFKTGKAFVSAFQEELTKVITSSSTFQTLSGYVDQVGTAFSNLSTGAGEVFDKIVSGLSDAIPTALSGVSDSVGTLMDKAGLGGVADSLDGVSGFLGDVYDNAMGKLGYDAGTTTGSSMADGIKENKELKTAPADALGSDGAIAATEQAGKDNAKAFADAQKEWLDANAAYYEAGYNVITGKSWTEGQSSKTGYAGLFGRGATDVVVEDQGLNYKIHSLATKFGTDVSLYVDGQLMATGSGYGSKKEALEDLFNKGGFPLSEATSLKLQGRPGDAALVEMQPEVTIDTYLDFAENLKSEMAAAGEEINAAFLEGLTPDKASIESRLESIRTLQLYDAEEARKQGADKAIEFLTGLQSALADYEEAKATYLLEPDNELAAKALQIARDRLQEGLDKNPLVAKVTADTSLFNTKMDDLAGSVDLKKLISDPAEFKATVMDIPEFMENTWQPAMQEEITFFKTQWHSGIGVAQQETEDFLDAMINAANNMPMLFSPEQIDILYQYSKGLIDAGSAIDSLSEKVGKVGEKAKESSVGWDSLKDSMKGCGDAASDTSEGLGCALSDFAKWQEDQSDLFSGSYIGQGGAQYLDWKLPIMQQIADTQEAMRIIGGSVLGEDYTQKVQEIKMKLSVDKTEADTAITDIETKATKEQKMPFKVDDIEAKTTLTAVETEAQKARTMPLKIDDSQAKAAIRGIDAAASRPVTKIVYVQEVSGGGGGSSYWGPGPDLLDDSLFGDWNTFPSYGAGDVFVSQPTLAVVGDRPGGEWIGGLDQAQARFGGSGKAGNIVVNYSPTIYSNMGREELADLLEEHDEKLMDTISEKLKSSQHW